VSFLDGDQIAIAGESVVLRCELSDDIWASGVLISRSIDGQEQEMCTVNGTGQGSCTEQRFNVTSSTTMSTLTVEVNLNSADCEDTGQYFCEPVSDTSARSGIMLTAIRE